MAEVLRDVTFTIASVTNEHGVVADLTAENCTILGPAVVTSMEGSTMNGCRWDTSGGGIEAILWEIDPVRQSVVGATALVDTHLTNCTLHLIGFAGTPEVIAQFVNDVTIPD